MISNFKINSWCYKLFYEHHDFSNVSTKYYFGFDNSFISSVFIPCIVIIFYKIYALLYALIAKKIILIVDRQNQVRLNTVNNRSTVKKQVTQRDKSTNCCHNSFDMTYDLNDQNSEENEKPQNDGGGWNYIRRPGQKFSGESLSAEESDIFGGAQFGAHDDSHNQYYDDRADTLPTGQSEGLNQYYSPTYGTYYGTHPIAEPGGGNPAVVSITQQPEVTNVRPPSMVFVENENPTTNPSVSQNTIVPMDRINWRNIAALALTKLSVIQMNAIVFLKFLFFLLFKVKFFLALIFFKFILLSKFLTTLKLQTLLFFPFLPFFTYLVSPATVAFLIPGWIKNNLPLFNQTDSMYQPNNMTSSDSESKSVANEDSRSLGKVTFRQSAFRMPNSAKFTHFSVRELQLFSTISEIFIKHYPLNVWQNDSIKILNKILDSFQNDVLNSKNCIESIACRMAVLRRTGKIPL